jgi:copper chaperone CopZ
MNSVIEIYNMDCQKDSKRINESIIKNDGVRVIKR